MFANEDWSGPLTGLEPAFEADAAAFHEAGRAVAGYALSFGCASVEVTINHRTVEIDDGEASLWGFTGVSYASKREHKLAVAAMRAGSLQAAIALGVGICAGPAAERRFRIETGMPQRLLEATVDDHRAVDDRIAKNLGDRRFAYLRLVWANAQCLIDQEPVWPDISNVADRLSEEMGNVWPEVPGRSTVRLPGETVRVLARDVAAAPPLGRSGDSSFTRAK